MAEPIHWAYSLHAEQRIFERVGKLNEHRLHAIYCGLRNGHYRAIQPKQGDTELKFEVSISGVPFKFVMSMEMDRVITVVGRREAAGGSFSMKQMLDGKDSLDAG